MKSHGCVCKIKMSPKNIFDTHWFRHLPLSVFWHTSNVVLDVVSDVVNFSFFFPRKFWCFKFGVFFSHVNFDVVNLVFFFSHVNFVVNLSFFFPRKCRCCKFGVFFPHVNFDVLNLAFFFFSRKFWCCKFGVFFSRKFWCCEFIVFFPRKCWCCKFGVFFPHVNFDVVNLAFFFLT